MHTSCRCSSTSADIAGSKSRVCRMLSKAVVMTVVVLAEQFVVADKRFELWVSRL